MTMQRHEDVRGRLEEYALGQLAPAARVEVEEHVAGCAECTTEVRELRLVMEGLGRAVDPVPLPAGLKRRVLDALSREHGTVPGMRDQAATSRRVWNPWLAAAAVAILALGSLLVASLDRSRRALEEARLAQAEAAGLRDRLEGFAGQTDLALSILTAGDMSRLELSGADAWSGSVARAYWSPTRGLLVVADRLPQPPPGRIYQVWVIGGTTPVSAGLLGSPQTGRGMLIVAPPSGVAGGPVTVAVTDEPPGGLPAPTGSIRLAGSL
jgi:anti-sigma-K factor RskA